MIIVSARGSLRCWCRRSVRGVGGVVRSMSVFQSGFGFYGPRGCLVIGLFGAVCNMVPFSLASTLRSAPARCSVGVVWSLGLGRFDAGGLVGRWLGGHGRAGCVCTACCWQGGELLLAPPSWSRSLLTGGDGWRLLVKFTLDPRFRSDKKQYFVMTQIWCNLTQNSWIRIPIQRKLDTKQLDHDTILLVTICPKLS